MNTFLHRLSITAWRKKSAILISVGILSLIIFGLQYSKIKDDVIHPFIREDISSGAAAAAFSEEQHNVRFVSIQLPNNELKINTGTNIATELNINILSKIEQPSRDEIGKRYTETLESDQQLGIPFVNLDTVHPYIPKKRIVHLDLKGAPPIIGFFKKFFSIIKNLGATGILIEYEDMFPFKGSLKKISAKNCYSPKEISEILKLAENYSLNVIPLVQTFGHVEFILKHKDFIKLREVEGSPQALCPSRNISLNFIKEMLYQVIEMHPNIKYLHIGCDEVFQMGECELCRLELHETLFLKHIKNVANIIHEKYPKLHLIIWDDMLRHISQTTMMETNLGNLVEPMVWVYAEDIYRFVQQPIWDKYSTVFKTAWTASAFKGAFGETLSVPDAKRHLENNLRWLDVMSQQERNFKLGFSGLVITGWQRYDHFAVLCELLPAAIPSLTLSLLAITHGYFNASLKNKFINGLSCPQPMTRNGPFINLDNDPFLWDKIGRCMFPGSQFFRLTYRLNNMENEVKDFIQHIKKHKGWMTDYNVRHNYSLPLRVDELTSDLSRIYHGATSLIRSTIDAMNGIFDNYTISEWIEQKIYPYIIELELIQNQTIALKNINHWPSRPLPPLKDLQRFGVPVIP